MRNNSSYRTTLLVGVTRLDVFFQIVNLQMSPCFSSWSLIDLHNDALAGGVLAHVHLDVYPRGTHTSVHTQTDCQQPVRGCERVSIPNLRLLGQATDVVRAVTLPAYAARSWVDPPFDVF